MPAPNAASFPCFARASFGTKAPIFRHTRAIVCLRLVWHSNMDQGLHCARCYGYGYPHWKPLPLVFRQYRAGIRARHLFLFLVIKYVCMVYLGWTISKTTCCLRRSFCRWQWHIDLGHLWGMGWGRCDTTIQVPGYWNFLFPGTLTGMVGYWATIVEHPGFYGMLKPKAQINGQI